MKQQLTAILLFVTLVSFSASGQTNTGSSEEWEVSVAPYVFFSGLKGTIGVQQQNAIVDARFPDIFRNLDFAMMGTFEARKGNWMILTDAMYMSLSGKRITPSPFFSDIDVKVKETIIDPGRVSGYEP